MPLYEFVCAKCGQRSEVFSRRITADPPAPACPDAGRERGHVMNRAMSRFAQHLDLSTKLAVAEATFGKEVDAAMGPEPDVGRLARRMDRVGKGLPPGDGPKGI